MGKLSGKWSPVASYTPNGGVRGDEVRSFTTKEGKSIELSVEYYSYWKWSIRVNGELIASTSGFGSTRKADAKKEAEHKARLLA